MDAGLEETEGYVCSDITDEFRGPPGFLEARVIGAAPGGWYYEVTIDYGDD